jgi:IS5 family transposase
MKRARACTRKLKTQLGRVIREVQRQTEEPSVKLDKLLQTAHRIYEQQRQDKDKIYSVHEPEVQCIAKGKAGKQYEFGNKVSVAVSSRGGWFVGAKSFTGNPYDGHTLAAQMKQVESLIANQVSEAYVDMGYRGHDYDGAVTVHVDKRRRGRTSEARWRWMKRRAAVEPSIGHLKNEHRLERNRLKGAAGNEINAILAAAAMNFQKLLRAFGRTFLYCLMQIWNGLIDLKGSQDRNTELQPA